MQPFVGKQSNKACHKPANKKIGSITVSPAREVLIKIDKKIIANGARAKGNAFVIISFNVAGNSIGFALLSRYPF